MNVFEDLIEELKEENLIEETVIETSRAETLAAQNHLPGKALETESFSDDANKKNKNTSTTPAIPSSETKEAETPASTEIPSQIDQKNQQSDNLSPNTQPTDEVDFYRRRASEEVTSLKIVEHVISSVEREMMKIVPKSYDELAVGIALHDFLHITADPNSPEHSISEFKLMQETESWYSALAQRDKSVTVGDLRRYCETTRPVLSLQALIALARFYRNAPFSDAVRSKFDMLITRLVTREAKNNRRELVFERPKLIEQIAGLYEDWSSIPLYAADDDSEILIAVLKFEDFISEVEKADTFEELIKNEFFNRLRSFKDGIGENFFSPLLLATAVECNVAVGNRYVELIEAERQKNNTEIFEEKYQSHHDLSISDAASKTLKLIELLHSVKEEEPEAPETDEKISPDVSIKPDKSQVEAGGKREKSKFAALKVNKWLLLTAVLVLILTGGLYIWVEQFSNAPEMSAGVEKVNLQGTALEEYFKAARISDDTYYAITQQTWKDLAKETKEDILKKTLAGGAQKGYSKVIVINGDGKTVGFASNQKGVEISDF